MSGPGLDVREEVAAAVRAGRPVVALESTLIAHGLPWPINLETARAAETAVRAAGAVPATIAVWRGRPTVGLGAAELEWLARPENAASVAKASRRDLAAAIVGGGTAATTVAATMALAHRAGVSVFATGGIGGAHRVRSTEYEVRSTRSAAASRKQSDGPRTSYSVLRALFDISADLVELARTPVLVVCAGAKSILDLPRTLEILETLGVPVVGYRTTEFPAFYLRSSGLPVPTLQTPTEAAALFTVHRECGSGGMVLAQPVAEDVALLADEFAVALEQAETDAEAQMVRGPALTPFLLRRLAEITGGRTVRTNQALIVANARLAAEVAASR